MRVISGTARGLRLASPDGEGTRPTLDRVKEALFSMLTPYVRGARVLDLFAGSGALGIEALSRGAERAVFVDRSREAEAAVRANLERARLTDRAELLRTDALEYLSAASAAGEGFTLIFLDPPYESGLYEKAISLITARGLLAPSGIIAAEWDAPVGPPKAPPELESIRDRHYGRVNITLLRRKPE